MLCSIISKCILKGAQPAYWYEAVCSIYCKPNKPDRRDILQIMSIYD